MLALFQLVVAAFVALSFALVIGVPVTLALPDGWSTTKGTIYSGLFIWLIMVFAIGILSSFVI